MDPKILAAVKEKLQNQFREQFDLRISSIFVYPEGGEKPEAKEGEKFQLISTAVERLIETPLRSLVVLGNSGMGKTSVSLQFCENLWELINKGIELPIPIYVYLPQYKDYLDKNFLPQVLKNAHLNNAERATLFKHPLVIVLDGFDEAPIKTNLYTSLGFNEANKNIKMLITCRPEGLLHANVTDLFEVYTNDPDVNTFETLYLQPFNKELIEKYFEAYLENKKPSSKNIASSYQSQPLTVKTYMEWLDRLPSLKTLVTNPFLLYVTAKTLPTIIQDLPIIVEDNYLKSSNNHLTKNELFRQFLENWFWTQARRVKCNGLLAGLSREEVAAYMLAYAKNLANFLIGEDGHLINTPLKEEDCLQPWLVEPIYNENLIKFYQHKDPQLQQSRFFCEKDKKGKLTPAAKENLDAIRSGCILKTVGNRFQFLHKSITEYLAGQERENIFSKYYYLVENQLFSEEEESPMVLIKDIGILKSLAESVNEKLEFKELLEVLVLKSKEIPGLHIVAANAITILNRASVDFTGRDFSGIQIPGADLSGGRFCGTNFKGANLSDVNFRQANLMGSQWQGVNAEGIDFGEKAPISTPSGARSLAVYSPNQDMVHWLVGCLDGFVYRYDDKSRVQITHYRHKSYFGDSSFITAIAVHSQRHLLVTAGSDKMIWVWSLENNNKKAGILLKYRTDHLTLSSDGYWLATDLHLYSLSDKKTLTPVEIPLDDNEVLTKLLFSPDSQYVAASIKIYSNPEPTLYEIRLFETSNPLVRTQNLLDRTEKKLSGFTFSANGQWFVYSAFDKIYLMQMPERIVVKRLNADTRRIRNLTFTKDSTWLAFTGMDNSIRFCRMPQCESSFMLQNGIKNVDNLIFSPNGDYLAATYESTKSTKRDIVSFWQMPQGIMIDAMRPASLKLNSVAFSPEAGLLAMADDKYRLQYVFQNKEEIILNVEEYNSSPVKDICISYDGQWLALYASYTKIQFLYRGKPASVLNMPGDRMLKMRDKYWSNGECSMAFSPNGSWFAASLPDCIILSRLPEVIPALKEKMSMFVMENSSFPITFSQDSTLLITSGEHVTIWNLPQDESTKNIQGRHLYTMSQKISGNNLVITPNKEWLISTINLFELRLALWLISDGKVKTELWTGQLFISHLATSPQEKSWIASGSYDKRVCLWSIPDGKHLYTFFFNFEIALLMIHKEELYVGNSYGFLVCILIGDPYMENFKPKYRWSVGPSENLFLNDINITETLNLSENNKALCEQRGSVGIPHIQPSPYQAWCNLFKPIPGTVSQNPSLHHALILVAGKPIHTLTHNSWLVSIVRKRKNPERKGWFDFFNDSSFEGRRHIFFIIEGIKRHRRFIISAELVVNEATNQVQILLQPEENLEEFQKEVVDKVYQANQFGVKAETGETLLRNIQADQQKTIRYNYKGDGGSNSNNTIETHSCVSWCRKHIKGIGFNMDDKWYNFIVTLPGDVALPAEDHGSSSSAPAMKKGSS